MKQNRIIGVVGPKGSGKTYTVAEYLMDLFHPICIPNTNLTGQRLSGGDTTNPPTPAGDYFVLVHGEIR